MEGEEKKGPRDQGTQTNWKKGIREKKEGNGGIRE